MQQAALLVFTLVFSLVSVCIADISCHQCGAAELVPKFAKSALGSLNITTDAWYGDCSSKSSANSCQNGTYCIKRARIYNIGYSGVSFKWTTYTKGCATVREDDTSETPDNACYELGLTVNGTGYTSRRVDCYCNKDYCNSVGRVYAIFMITMFHLFLIALV